MQFTFTLMCMGDVIWMRAGAHVPCGARQVPVLVPVCVRHLNGSGGLVAVGCGLWLGGNPLAIWEPLVLDGAIALGPVALGSHMLGARASLEPKS